MFAGASKFNQNLCGWNMSSASSKDGFCIGAHCFPVRGCYEPFTTHDELQNAAQIYCEDPSGWNKTSSFVLNGV